MTEKEVYIAIIIMAAVTAAIRFAPFIFFSGRSGTPAAVEYLGKVLPYAIMGMLVVFCLKGVSFQNVSGFMPEAIASAAVVVSYVWKRNTLLSIVAGTAIYMVLTQMVF